MIIQCPKCEKKYKVDDRKIPVGGGPVRCPDCGNVFTVYREPLDIELIPIKEKEEEKVEKAPPEEEELLIEEEVETVSETGVQPEKKEPVTEPELEPEPEPKLEPEIEAEEPEIEAEEPEPEAGKIKEKLRRTMKTKKEKAAPKPAAEKIRKAMGKDMPETWSEEKKQKHKKARRLARSLAKDILLYHEDEVDRGLKKGNLASILKDEIKKSWKFYKGQVSKEVLDEKNYFKEALNEIVAKGKEIFV